MQRWVVVVGWANMDVVARTSAPHVPATSNPGHTRISPGGVGRNIAACLGLLGAPVRLVSAVGTDAFGDEVLRVTARCGADVSAVRRSPGATGTYTALLDDGGELVAAVSDMTVVDELELDTLHLGDAALVVVDGNLAPAQVERVLAAASSAGVPVALEPVSVAKAARLHGLVQLGQVFLVTPNSEEIGALTGRSGDWQRSVEDLHDRGVRHVWLREGVRGSYLCTAGEKPVHLPALSATVVDVTGAGDAMLAAWVAAWLRGSDPVEAARAGHRAAAATIESPHTVRPDLAGAMAAFGPPTAREVPPC